VIENYFLVGTGFEGIIYARKDGHNVYFFAPDKEVLYYNFDPSDDKEYFVPDGITRFGEWPLGASIGFVYVMKKTDVDNNQITFLTKGPEGYSNYKHSSKFEKGKGLIQVISQGDLGTVIYDLVEVYR
jgi:ribosomal protein L24E